MDLPIVRFTGFTGRGHRLGHQRSLQKKQAIRRDGSQAFAGLPSVMRKGLEDVSPEVRFLVILLFGYSQTNAVDPYNGEIR